MYICIPACIPFPRPLPPMPCFPNPRSSRALCSPFHAARLIICLREEKAMGRPQSWRYAASTPMAFLSKMQASATIPPITSDVEQTPFSRKNDECALCHSLDRNMCLSDLNIASKAHQGTEANGIAVVPEEAFLGEPRGHTWLVLCERQAH